MKKLKFFIVLVCLVLSSLNLIQAQQQGSFSSVLIGGATYTSPLSVGSDQGVKLSVGNSDWSNKSIIETGWDTTNGDFTDIKVSSRDSNNAFIRLLSNGNVGIGITTPVITYGANNKHVSTLDINGQIHLPYLGSIWIGGYNDQGKRLRLHHDSIDAYIDYVPNLHFRCGEDRNECFFLDSLGNIGIGTTKPKNKLEVNGTIHAKEALIDINNWSDFVFEKDYKIKPIQEVYEYIKKNGHLPDVPVAVDVINNGLNVGEFQAKLLQKIEELTLFVAEQDRVTKKQAEIIKEQEDRIKRLELKMNK